MYTLNRDLVEELSGELKLVVAHEMRGVALTLPREDVKPVGPHDSDAEQKVLSAVLCGYATPDHVRPLESKHFYTPFNGRLFQLLGETTNRDLSALADLLDVRGPVLEELVIIRGHTVFVAVQLLHIEVDTIVNRWRERELIRSMQKIDAELRVGALTYEVALARLLQHRMEHAG